MLATIMLMNAKETSGSKNIASTVNNAGTTKHKTAEATNKAMAQVLVLLHDGFGARCIISVYSSLFLLK
jgi:hypothetical protein